MDRLKATAEARATVAEAMEEAEIKITRDIMTREEMFKVNESKFNQLEAKYGVGAPEFDLNCITSNDLYFESFPDLYNHLPDAPFKGKFEVIRSFVGDYIQTGVKNKCILNFASAKYPGGGVRHGSIAQEEDICRNTLLYFYLQTYESSYASGKFVGTDHLLDDFVIYSFAVPTVKPDLTLGECNDYITSAAPDLRLLGNATLDRDGKTQLHRTWIRRVMGVLGAAKKHGAKELVLGPWGCGVFKNDPKFVAWCFEIMLDHYGAGFEYITFLVPDDVNYEQFKRFESKNK